MVAQSSVPVIRMQRKVFEEIRSTVGLKRPETGGILGGRFEDGVVREFSFDHAARRTSVTYSPDCTSLNQLLSEDWNPRGIRMLGFVHSHPNCLREPSWGDIQYAERILNHNEDLPELYLPIVFPSSDYKPGFRIFPFAAVRHGRHVRIEPRGLKLTPKRETTTEFDDPVSKPALASRRGSRRSRGRRSASGSG